ncbi:MAG: response regulator, partial [Burkholderiales bacterium]
MDNSRTAKPHLRLVDSGGSDAKRDAKRVLVVEDDTDHSQLAKMWLESLGYEVMLTASPHEALRLLGEKRFDVMFTDVAMPGTLDGVALANRVKTQFPAVRLLLTSSYSDRVLVDFDLPAPLLKKPFG